MGKKNGWVKVGTFGVDAGLCWIGDPCYVLHSEGGTPKELGKDWGAFCDMLPKGHEAKQFKFKNGAFMGVCVPTGYGDGIYDVMAQFEDGRVKAIKVEFF